MLKKVSPENWIAMVLGVAGGATVIYASGPVMLAGILLLMWGNNIVQTYFINKELDALNRFFNEMVKKL